MAGVNSQHSYSASSRFLADQRCQSPLQRSAVGAKQIRDNDRAEDVCAIHRGGEPILCEPLIHAHLAPAADLVGVQHIAHFGKGLSVPFRPIVHLGDSFRRAL